MGEPNAEMASNVQKVRGVVRGVVVCVGGRFGTPLSLRVEDAKFSHSIPANLLPLILAFFSSLFSPLLVPLFFYSSSGFK